MASDNDDQYSYSPVQNSRTRSLLKNLIGFDGTSARYGFIDSLSTSDRAELFKGLSKSDKAKYELYLKSTVGEKKRAAREQRLVEARLGNAKELRDVVEVLYESLETLSANDALWVKQMDETGTRRAGMTFTPRQSEVFWSIYRKNFPLSR